MSRFRAVTIAAATAIIACTAGNDALTGDPEPRDVAHPRDDTLTFADLQALGTHNSYHLITTPPAGLALAEWDYEHLPLERQLGEQGVRQFELDVYRDPDSGSFDVLHFPLIDAGTNCPTLPECVRAMAAWSRDNPGHHPTLTMIEPKDAPPSDPDEARQWVRDLSTTLQAASHAGWLITPDEVQGSAADLRTAIEGQGWPTLGALRGRALFVFHTGGAWRDALLNDPAPSPLFPDGRGELDAPYAAFHAMNDPSNPTIPLAVARGHLVRTRADANTVQARDNDSSQAEQAFASGAHFVSTDFPEPYEATGYVVRVPGGTPSRCNPLREAVADCRAQDIEDPTLLSR